MGRGCCSLLLLLLLCQWPGAAFSLLRYRYDCGDYGMQLQAYPSRGRSVRFKVMDEFGTRFDVANCSICLHWLSTGGDGAVIFSSGYDGCHVLVKDDRYLLRVQLEELLLSGAVAASYAVNITCPKPGHEILRDGSQAAQGSGTHQAHSDVLVPLAQPGLLHHVSQSSLTVSSSSQGHSEQLHSVAQTQPVLLRPGLQPQPQPASVHPGLPAQAHLGLHTQTQQGLTRPGRQPPVQPGQTQPGLLQTQTRPGLLNPGVQSQPGLHPPNHPGLLNPGAQSQPGLHTPNHPGLLNPGAQSQPGLHTPHRPGLLNPGAQSQPGLQPPNHPGLVHPGAQTQPGLHLPNHPGLVHPGAQPQPGLHPPNRPGLVHPGAQTQPGLHPPNRPGLVHPGAQTQPGLHNPHRPGLVHPVAQTQPGLHTPNRPGLVHPGAQPQPGLHPPNRPGLLNPGAQSQPGLHPPNRPGLVQPGAHTQPGLLQPGFQTQSHLGLVHHSVQSGSAHTAAQTQAGFIHTGAQAPNQPGFSRPSLQTHSQAGLLHPGLQNQAGLLHASSSQGDTALQSRPGMVRPGLQAQLHSGLEHPRLQSQAGLLQSMALFYPSAGAGTQLTREQCQVAAGKMPCVAPEGREACVQAGCCYNDMDRVTPCYYGNTATVQCLLDGHFVVVVPRGLGTQPYNLDSVRLASSQPGCEPLRLSEAFVMFRFAVTQCGTTVQAIEDRLIYENQLISTVDVQGSPRGSITRDSIYILQARCIYNATDLLPLHMEVAVPPTSTPLAMLGPLGLQLRIATDETYSSYHPSGDYPLVKVLRDPIYVEVRLLQKTDPNLVLVLHQCWAAPSTNTAAGPQWPILVDGCPFTGDNYRTQLIPVGPASPQLPFPSHYQRFAISTFTFVEPPSMAALEGEVYISCSASVCHLAQPEPCRPSCQLGMPSRARRSPADEVTAGALGMVTSQGGVILPRLPKG